MAIQYGSPRSDVNLYNKSNKYLSETEDKYVIYQIDKTYTKLTQDMDNEKTYFLNNIPFHIETIEKKIKLEKEKYNIKLSETNQNLEDLSEKENFFINIFRYINTFYLKKIYLPKIIKENNLIIKKLNEELDVLKNKPFEFFIKKHQKSIDLIKILEELKKDPLCSKAKMEISVLECLLQLDNASVVLCGLDINLNNIKIHKNKIKIINFDFIVINTKGIFLINILENENDDLKKMTIDNYLIYLFFKFQSKNKDLAVTQNRIRPLLINIGKNSLIKNESQISILNLEKLNEEILNNPDCLLDTEVATISNLLLNYTSKKEI